MQNQSQNKQKNQQTVVNPEWLTIFQKGLTEEQRINSRSRCQFVEHGKAPRRDRKGGQKEGWGSHPDGDDVARAGDNRKTPVH